MLAAASFLLRPDCVLGKNAEDICCGSLYDIRGSEILLGNVQLRLAADAELLFEGRKVKAAELLQSGRMSYACAHIGEDGLVNKVCCSRSAFSHKNTADKLEIICSSGKRVHQGDPLYICVYSDNKSESPKMSLFIDGTLIESSQIKQKNMLYYKLDNFEPGLHKAKAYVKCGDKLKSRVWDFEILPL